MKKLMIKVGQILGGFLLWLEHTYYYERNGILIKFKESSVFNYKRYMAQAVEDLGMEVRELAQQSISVLKQILESLKSSESFKRRDEKEQSNIISAFHSYITYKNQA